MGDNEKDYDIIPTTGVNSPIPSYVIMPNQNNKIRERKKQNQQQINSAKKPNFKINKYLTRIYGNPEKSRLFSPAIMGFGFIAIITLALLFINVSGIVTIPFPGPSIQTVQIKGTQTLTWDQYYSESSFLSKGNIITYSVASENNFSFIITNNSLENFPFSNTSLNGDLIGSLTINALTTYNGSSPGCISYLPFFLKKGSTITYNFTANLTPSTIGNDYRFFIIDQPTWSNWSNSSWLQWIYKYSAVQSSYSLPTNKFNYQPSISSVNNGSFTAPNSQEWYLVWTNVQNLDSQNISYSIHYSISTIDTSTANVHIFRSNNISQNSFIAPASGMYTFYIFANPAINSTNPIQGVSVTYNVIFYKNINAHDKWNETVPYLLAIIIISVAIIIFAEVQRERTSYILNLNKKTTLDQNQLESELKDRTCQKCGTKNSIENFFCQQCGSKLKSGHFESLATEKPIGTEYCSICGSVLKINQKFCPKCGNELQ